MNPKVDQFFDRLVKWYDELNMLRSFALASGLTEELKWGHPCYTTESGANVAILGGFKAYCVLSFLKGGLLKDEAGLLVRTSEHQQLGRVMRFTALEQILEHKECIESYLREAIEVERAGLTLPREAMAMPLYPSELVAAFAAVPEYEQAFERLTPGRRRGYLLHFVQAKQSATRESRIQRSWERILAGKGLDDCTCGLSRRLPRCDGSHKQLG